MSVIIVYKELYIEYELYIQHDLQVCICKSHNIFKWVYRPTFFANICLNTTNCNANFSLSSKSFMQHLLKIVSRTHFQN